MLYGRDEERDRIGALLERARRSCSGVLLLRGEPGIGKTALLQDARARSAGILWLHRESAFADDPHIIARSPAQSRRTAPRETSR